MKKQIGLMLALLAASSYAQQAPTPKPPAQTEEVGPQTDNGPIVLPRKKDEPAPPPAPAEEKVRNPNGTIYSMRVDVPRVNLDVSVLLDSTHDFVPGLKPQNFLVVEDGVEQQIEAVHMARTPITAAGVCRQLLRLCARHAERFGQLLPQPAAGRLCGHRDL
jgi:hypothetical protein